MPAYEDVDERSPLLSAKPSVPQSDVNIVEVVDVEAVAQEDAPPAANRLQQFFGIVLVVCAGLIFTGGNVLQKRRTAAVNYWHLLLFRSVMQIFIAGCDVAAAAIRRRRAGSNNGVVAGARSNNVFGISWADSIRLAAQGLLGGLLLLCIFVTIKLVPLGNASAIFFCTPVFTFVFAVCMLGERMGAYRVAISTVMLAGVLLITHPPFVFGKNMLMTDREGVPLPSLNNSFSVLGYFVAVMVPVLSAIVSIITRQLKHLRAGLLVLWFGLGALAVSAGGLVVSGSFDFSPYASDWQLDVSILGVVLLGMAGNVLYTLAMRWVSPSKGNVFRSFEVILNCALQVALDHVPFYWLTGIGICLLLVAVVATGFESDVMARFGGRRRWRFL